MGLKKRSVVTVASLAILASAAQADMEIVSADFESATLLEWSSRVPSPGPPCDALVSEDPIAELDELEDVVEVALADLSLEHPTSEHSYWRILDRVGELAGCEVPRAGGIRAAVARASCVQYDSLVSYCGPGDSTFNLVSALTYPASGWLNELCFEHDRCYDSKCPQGVLCAWSKRSGIDGCDQQFFSAVLGHVTSNALAVTRLDLAIAAVALELKAIHTVAPNLCGTSKSCGGGGLCAHGCGSQLGECLAPIPETFCDYTIACASDQLCNVEENVCVQEPSSPRGAYRFRCGHQNPKPECAPGNVLTVVGICVHLEHPQLARVCESYCLSGGIASCSGGLMRDIGGPVVTLGAIPGD